MSYYNLKTVTNEIMVKEEYYNLRRCYEKRKRF
nr:MAG TPA: hypothetical protein [Caudoviricetes sp.]